ncbi:MAG: HD domain-containing protein [Caldisericia bacterium]|nr:HD domain-containing protein [Caldisericia bacterium]
MPDKIIRDPIHGYIKIEEPYIKNIVDHPLFQRLRRIEQTSMRVLYPSAHHDRFSHSLGTYHLGKKAFHYFVKNIEADLNIHVQNKELIKHSFLVACLLHDIGHSPFSHTFEKFFERQLDFNTMGENFKPKTILLHQCVQKAYQENIKDSSSQELFHSDFLSGNVGYGSPHEKMSSLIVLECFSEILKEHFPPVDLDMIVRSIIGCTYYHFDMSNRDLCQKYGIRNCLIRLLNSEIIDVDKLDYLNRDMTFAGYDNVLIDTERLLSSLSAVWINDDELHCRLMQPAYRKNALSVVENAIRAKSSINQWIYNHHAVSCEQALFVEAFFECVSKEAICPKVGCEHRDNCVKNHHSCIQIDSERISVFTNDKDVFINSIFSANAIKGSISCNGYNFTLLSDDDIHCIFKRHPYLQSVQEILCRNKRRKAIWKSDEELSSISNKVCGHLSIDNLNTSIHETIQGESRERSFFDISRLFPSVQSKIWTLKLSKNNTPIENDKILILFGRDDSEKACVFSRFSDLVLHEIDESKKNAPCEYLLYAASDNVLSLRENYRFIKEIANLFSKKPVRT